METVNLCICGCGEPATHAASHTHQFRPAQLTEVDYTMEDRGYSTPCWISVLTGLRDGTKYVMVRVAGKKVLAHRAMYEQTKGPIPEGLWIDHLCHQTRCMNPDHLEAVTPEVNMQRRRNAKLTLEQAHAIKNAQGSTRAFDLAAQYGVTVSLIYLIWTGKVWKNA